MLKKNEIVTVRIEDMSKDGEGIGKADGFALFVKDTVPGDLVEAGIMKMKKTYGYARLIRVLKSSPDRTEAPCPVAKQCGGCRLQMMTYDSQLRMKQSLVRNALERIGGFSVRLEGEQAEQESEEENAGDNTVLLQKIVPSAAPLRYRNKAVIPVGADREGKPAAGFFAAHSHTIIPCEDCLLGPEENAEILRIFLEWMEEQHIEPYDEKSGTGLIRHIFLRKSREEGCFQLCLIVNGKRIPAVKQLQDSLDRLRTPEGKPLIAGACFSINTRNTNVIFGKPAEALWGDPVITDSLHAVKAGITRHYRISPASFYQVNPAVAEKIYDAVLEFADLTGSETVFDLYCGTGTIALFLAAKAARVIGVEVVPDAVRNAEENARLNGCTNVRFIEGKAEEIIPDLVRMEQLAADVVVVDPPRKGCAMPLLQTIVNMHSRKIVYVSCDPATMARDMKYLCANGYRAVCVRPYDQFAMSTHVESCVLLERVSNRKADSYVKLNVRMEDYYRIKDAEKKTDE